MKNFSKLLIIVVLFHLVAFSCSKNEAEEVKVAPPPTGCDSAVVEIPMKHKEKMDSLLDKQFWKYLPEEPQWNFVINSQEEYEAVKKKMWDFKLAIYEKDLPQVDFGRYTLLAGSTTICALYTTIVSQRLLKKCNKYTYEVRLKLSDDFLQPSPGRASHFFIVEKLPPNAKINFDVKVLGCGYK